MAGGRHLKRSHETHGSGVHNDFRESATSVVFFSLLSHLTWLVPSHNGCIRKQWRPVIKSLLENGILISRKHVWHGTTFWQLILWAQSFTKYFDYFVDCFPHVLDSVYEFRMNLAWLYLMSWRMQHFVKRWSKTLLNASITVHPQISVK